MTDEEFARAYPVPDIQWWTAEEYAAWLENEKQELQSIIGSKGWTSGTGWFTWTQEMVDEIIVKYEEVLAMIENGYLVSKSVDGDEDTLIMSGGPMQATATDEGDVAEKDEIDYKSLFSDYKRCGLTSQNNDGNLYWNGQRVRIFVDGTEFSGGYASKYEHYDPEGTIDVRTVRERVDNGDGSYGETIAERMARYAPYGVSYQEKDGKKIIRYNGKSVKSFVDIAPDGSVFSVGSTDGGEIVLVTDYDGDGTLKGVKAMMSYRF